MLEHYQKLVDSNGKETKDAPGDYVKLHLPLTSAWQRRILQYNVSPAVVLSASSVIAVLALINLFAFSCIPAAYICCIGNAFSINFVDLSNVVAANDQIEAIRSLYLEAAEELHELRREVLCGDHITSPELFAAIEAEAEVLGSYLDVDRYRIRFWGFVVSYGMVRTLLVTLVTLIVGLWSILRGLGCFVTLETICPFKTF